MRRLDSTDPSQKYFSTPDPNARIGSSFGNQNQGEDFGHEYGHKEREIRGDASRANDSLKFSADPSDLIQSSLVLRDVVVGSEGNHSAQKLFKTAHIRDQRNRIREMSDQSFDESSSAELSPKMLKSPKTETQNPKKKPETPNLVTSKTSFGGGSWGQSLSRNPFQNSELQESSSHQKRSLQDSLPQIRKFTKSQESAQTVSFNSLIHSNENALKNIIKAHDLDIEASLGRDTYESDIKASKPMDQLEVIPEMGFKKEQKARKVVHEISGESEDRINESELEHDENAAYLMKKLNEVMQGGPVSSLESSLIEHTNLNPESKELLVQYFKKQDQKFQENKRFIDETYSRLKKDRQKIETQLGEFGEGYRRKIEELETANKEKEKEIKKLKNKNKLLGIKKRSKKSQEKEKKKSTNDKYLSEKVRNLSRLLEEKNKKIKSLNSKIDDLKIDNQAMKELLHELSSKGLPPN